MWMSDVGEPLVEVKCPTLMMCAPSQLDSELSLIREESKHTAALLAEAQSALLSKEQQAAKQAEDHRGAMQQLQDSCRDHATEVQQADRVAAEARKETEAAKVRWYLGSAGVPNPYKCMSLKPARTPTWGVFHEPRPPTGLVRSQEAHRKEVQCLGQAVKEAEEKIIQKQVDLDK